jgi:PP-loop superfamily ATP-utilizing enzyme
MELETQKTLKAFKPKLQIDLSNFENGAEIANEVFKKVNTKDYGKKISMGYIVGYALSKLTDSDIKKLQESTLSSEDKLRKAFEEYKVKHECHELEFFDFIALQSKILKH